MWYYAEGSQRLGPVDDARLQELVSQGVVRGNTLVWKQGMANWQPYAALAGAPPPLAMASVPPAPAAVRPDVPSHLVPAILVTILCCLPLGIPAIVYASQVGGKLAAGDQAGAAEASRKASLWCWIAAGAGLVGSALWIGLVILGGLAG